MSTTIDSTEHQKSQEPHSVTASAVHPIDVVSHSRQATVGEGDQSSLILARARRTVAGGADSAMRVLDYHLPLVVERADGPYIWDANGTRLIDLNAAYGPLLFGHRAPVVMNALRDELSKRGSVIGFPHQLSHEAAELVHKSVPSIEKLRFASTGTEVVQTAVRLARAFTGRTIIVLFEGHYHGSSDAVFHRYHARPDTLEIGGRPLPGTSGMAGAPHEAHLLPWNDIRALRAFFEEHGKRTAAVVMEPVMGNAGVIAPIDGYLHAVREITREFGSLLIFDEVITGFRVARGGAQERFGVASDLTTLSKALNGGVPVSAVGGRADIMDLLTDCTVFHGGVYSGNPLSMAATVAVQREYDAHAETIYPALESAGNQLAAGLRSIFASRKVPVIVTNVGAMLGFDFVRPGASPEVHDYRTWARAGWKERRIAFQQAAQRAGVYFHPNPFEPLYLSTTHTPEVVSEVLEIIEEVAAKFDWNAEPTHYRLKTHAALEQAPS